MAASGESLPAVLYAIFIFAVPTLPKRAVSDRNPLTQSREQG
jgi:hypothetical protein